jgi:hypothetical protein
MKKLQDIVEYCSSKENAYIDFPFGRIAICIKYNVHVFIVDRMKGL